MAKFLWKNDNGPSFVVYRLTSSTFRIFMRPLQSARKKKTTPSSASNTFNRVLLFSANKSYSIFNRIGNRIVLQPSKLRVHNHISCLPLRDANSIPYGVNVSEAHSVFIVHHFGSCQFTAGVFSLREWKSIGGDGMVFGRIETEPYMCNVHLWRPGLRFIYVHSRVST